MQTEINASGFYPQDNPMFPFRLEHPMVNPKEHERVREIARDLGYVYHTVPYTLMVVDFARQDYPFVATDEGNSMITPDINVEKVFADYQSTDHELADNRLFYLKSIEMIRTLPIRNYFKLRTYFSNTHLKKGEKKRTKTLVTMRPMLMTGDGFPCVSIVTREHTAYSFCKGGCVYDMENRNLHLFGKDTWSTLKVGNFSEGDRMAFRLLLNGGTISDAASSAGMSAETLSKHLQKYYSDYGVPNMQSFLLMVKTLALI